MINKILPKINSSALLQRSKLKCNNSKLKNLAGSSLSGWNTPNFQPAEMIIPGGLDFKEKAYFALKGKLPKSVLERWVPMDGNVLHSDDQVVTVNIADNYVGSIIDSPHSVSVDSNLIDDPSDSGISDIFHHIFGN